MLPSLHWENFTQTLDNIAAWLLRFKTYEETVIQVKSVEDILRAKREETRVGVILGFQNATPIENDLDRLALFHALGVKIITVDHSTSATCWGAAATSAATTA